MAGDTRVKATNNMLFPLYKLSIHFVPTFVNIPLGTFLDIGSQETSLINKIAL